MGTISFDQKCKNMEMELEVYRNYIHDQNIFFKNKLQLKEDQHRQEMNNMFLQKDSMIEELKRDLAECEPKLKNMHQVNALLQSKDNTIQQLKQHNSSLRQDKDSQINQLRSQLDEVHQKMNSTPLNNVLLNSKDTEIQKLRGEIASVHNENEYLQKVNKNYQKIEENKNKIIDDLKQKNSDLEALKVQELRNHSTELANVRALRTEAEDALEKLKKTMEYQSNQWELEKKKLQDTIKRLDVPNYKEVATIKGLRETIVANKVSLEAKEREVKTYLEKLYYIHNVISKLKRDTNEKTKHILPASQIPNEDIYRTKYENILVIIGDECVDIIDKIKEGSTTDYSVVSNLEATIESLQREIEQLRGENEGKSCAICYQSLVFPKCTECNQIYHGECIHRAFMEKNSSECCYCRTKSIKFPFEFVPVQRQGRNH